MKIAHIAPPWLAIPPKNYGGTETVLFNLVEEQVAQGHEVTLLAPGDAKTSAHLVSFFDRSLVEDGIPWVAHLKPFYHLYKSVDYIRRHQFDIVHTHLSSTADMYLFPLLSDIATPVITTLHSRFPFDRVNNDWLGKADLHYMEWLTSVPLVAISQSARDEVEHKKLHFMGVVHHGLNMDVFKPETYQPDDYLVWLGRFVPEKGPHLAVQAAKATGKRLVLAGTVDRHVPESVAYFEEVISPLVDGKQITYIGPVNLEEKIHLLSHATAMLNPIEWEEPFGMVMIEAMSVGCPVIAFARGAAPEIVTDGENGYLVRTVEEMIEAIATLPLLDRYRVRAYAEKNFSARAMADKYQKYYHRVIAMSFLELASSPLGTVERKLAKSAFQVKPKLRNASSQTATTDPLTDALPSLSVTMTPDPELFS